MTPFELASRYIGIAEMSKKGEDHPLIVWWLSLCGFKKAPDEVPWCSAFVNGVMWELRLSRSKSAMARSWLGVGKQLTNINDAVVGNDVVVMWRGTGTQGHVGFFAGWVPGGGLVRVLGGNQTNSVNIETFPVNRVLGIVRVT